MRQMRSSGSVKAFYWDREDLLERLREAADEALKRFPEIEEIRLFGSLAQGTETGLSDVDIFLLLEGSAEKNPLERMKPYYSFFSDKLEVALDMIVAVRDELDAFKHILKGSLLLGKKDGQELVNRFETMEQRGPNSKVLDEIIRRIVEVAQPEQIILFGSAARGEMSPHSDVDLLVVKSGAHRRRLAQAIYLNLFGAGQAVDVIVVTPEDLERYRYAIGLIIEPVLKEGKVVYERGALATR